MLVHHRLEAVVGSHRGQRGVVARASGPLLPRAPARPWWPGLPVVQGLDGSCVVAGCCPVHGQVCHLHVGRQSGGQPPAVTCVPSVTSLRCPGPRLGFYFPLCFNLDRIFGRVAVFCFKPPSVPDDTPPASPASMPQPLWGSTYFLTPAAAEALWPFLNLGERASLQAAEWWAHADLRWYIRGMAALPDLLRDSSSSASEQEALRTRRPRRTG